jgi:photosystem II stability/assembly factor-like uncharacterized protein
MTRRALTSKDGAIWIQPGGPNNTVYFLDCKDLGDLVVGDGTTTLLQCFDASGTGWETVGSTQAQPDAIAFDITGLMFESLDWLESVECPFALYVLQRDCGRADNYSNYIRGFAINNVRRSSRTYSGVVSRSEDTETTMAAALEAYPPLVNIEKLEVVRKTNAGILAVNDVAFNIDRRCLGECGDEQDPCEHGMFVGQAAAGVAEIYQTTDSGDTWTAVAADPFGATFSAVSVVRFPYGRVGARYVVAREGTGPAVQGQTAYTDDNGATWTTSNIGGAAVGHGATEHGGLFALDERHIWCAGFGGFIYFSDDGSETWTAQEEAAITAGSYACISFDPTGQYGVAGAPGDIIAVTSDGGASWVASAANTGAGGDILCCARFDSNRMWVGTDDGTLWYSRDGGTSWTQRTGWPGSGAGTIQDMAWIDDQVCFMSYNAAGPVGHVNYTFDGGMNWTRITTPVNVGLNGIFACTTSHAFTVGLVHAATGYVAEIQPD